MTDSQGAKVVEMRALINEGKELSSVNPGQALKKWREAMNIANELYGTTDNTTLFCRNNMAAALLQMNVLNEALDHYRFLVSCYEAVAPKNGDTLVMAYLHLGLAYFGLDRFEEALAMWTKALDLSLKLHGAEYRLSLYCERRIVSALMQLKRHGEALSILERLFTNARVTIPTAATTGLYARDVAFCLNALERYSDAAHYLKISIEIVRQNHPDGHPAITRLMNSLNWTRARAEEKSSKREKLFVERYRLAEVVLKSEDDLEQIKVCKLEHEQFVQVLLRLKKTYAEAPNANHLRITRKPMGMKLRPAQKARLRQYESIKAAGVGIAYDEEFVVRDGGAEVVLMLGYHAS